MAVSIDVSDAIDRFGAMTERILRMLKIQLIILVFASAGTVALAWLVADWPLAVVIPVALLLALPVIVDLVVLRQLMLVYAIPGQLKEVGDASKRTVAEALEEFTGKKQIVRGRLRMFVILFKALRKLGPLANQPGELAQSLAPVRTMAHPFFYLPTLATQIVSPLVVVAFLVVALVVVF